MLQHSTRRTLIFLAFLSANTHAEGWTPLDSDCHRRSEGIRQFASQFSQMHSRWGSEIRQDEFEMERFRGNPLLKKEGLRDHEIYLRFSFRPRLFECRKLKSDAGKIWAWVENPNPSYQFAFGRREPWEYNVRVQKMRHIDEHSRRLGGSDIVSLFHGVDQGLFRHYEYIKGSVLSRSDPSENSEEVLYMSPARFLSTAERESLRQHPGIRFNKLMILRLRDPFRTRGRNPYVSLRDEMSDQGSVTLEQVMVLELSVSSTINSDGELEYLFFAPIGSRDKGFPQI